MNTQDCQQNVLITQELLEKNGFRRVLTSEAFLCELVYSDGDAYVSVVFWEDGALLVRMENKSVKTNGINKVHNCDIRCLHELQQAMQLCGIRKEVVE